MRVHSIFAGILVATTALPLAAQESRESRSRNAETRIPESFTPPAGMCRLWLDGVPASQQPAATDCASALRNRPANASVVFGPARRGESVEMRGFTGRGSAAEVMRSVMPFSSRGREQAHSRDDARSSDEVRSSEARGRAMGEQNRTSPSSDAKPATPTTEAAKPAAPRKPEKPQ